MTIENLKRKIKRLEEQLKAYEDESKLTVHDMKSKGHLQGRIMIYDEWLDTIEKIEQSYIDLLYKTGQSINNIQVFINTISECPLFRKDMSDKYKASVQEYLTKQLLSSSALEVLEEYSKHVGYIQKQIKESTIDVDGNVELLETIFDTSNANKG